MKVLDQHGRPVLNNHQAVHQEMADEGLLEWDEELALLLMECGDDDGDWDYGDDWIDNLDWNLWDETCKRCGSVACRCLPEPPAVLSCYDDDGW